MHPLNKKIDIDFILEEKFLNFTIGKYLSNTKLSVEARVLTFP